MATNDTTTLSAESRAIEGSRAVRRLRRSGRVPGVVYGGTGEPAPFDVDARTLRHALAHGGAVIDLSIGDEKATPVVVKETQRHPVSGAIVHIDLLRVRLDRAIQATTVIELVGHEDAPGAKEGGVIEQVTREINLEALPTSIPDSIEVSVAEMEVNDTLTLGAVPAPEGVTFLDDLEETVIATCTPPRLAVEEEALEEETELVGAEAEEGAGAAEGEPAAEEAAREGSEEG